MDCNLDAIRLRQERETRYSLFAGEAFKTCLPYFKERSVAKTFQICLIDESHKSSSHSNKLLVDNGGIPKTKIDKPSAKNFGFMSRMYLVTKNLQIRKNFEPHPPNVLLITAVKV